MIWIGIYLQKYITIQTSIFHQMQNVYLFCSHCFIICYFFKKNVVGSRKNKNIFEYSIVAPTLFSCNFLQLKCYHSLVSDVRLLPQMLPLFRVQISLKKLFCQCSPSCISQTKNITFIFVTIFSYICKTWLDSAIKHSDCLCEYFHMQIFIRV